MTRKLDSCHRAFTIVEILVAMVFMAVVIPTVVQGILIANRMGVVSEREKVAVQLADWVLSESIVSGSWEDGSADGRFEDLNLPDYRWELESDTWEDSETLYEVSVFVYFKAQSREYSVRLSTLAEIAGEVVVEPEEEAVQ